MDRKLQRQFLGDLEKEVMEIMWETKEPLTVRFVFEKLVHKRKIAYTTVMTIMGRLESKGLLKQKSSQKAYSYYPAYTKDKFLAKISKQIIKNFVSNFGEAAIATFVHEVDKIPPAKKKELLKLLEGIDD